MVDNLRVEILMFLSRLFGFKYTIGKVIFHVCEHFSQISISINLFHPLERTWFWSIRTRYVHAGRLDIGMYTISSTNLTRLALIFCDSVVDAETTATWLPAAIYCPLQSQDAFITGDIRK